MVGSFEAQKGWNLAGNFRGRHDAFSHATVPDSTPGTRGISLILAANMLPKHPRPKCHHSGGGGQART